MYKLSCVFLILSLTLISKANANISGELLGVVNSQSRSLNSNTYRFIVKDAGNGKANFQIKLRTRKVLGNGLTFAEQYGDIVVAHFYCKKKNEPNDKYKLVALSREKKNGYVIKNNVTLPQGKNICLAHVTHNITKFLPRVFRGLDLDRVNIK